MGIKISNMTETGSAPTGSYLPLAFEGENYKVPAGTLVKSGEILFQVTRASNQILDHSITSTILFTDEVIASDSFDTSTSRFTPGVAGKYSLSWTFRTDVTWSAMNGNATVSIQKNGATTVFNQIFLLDGSVGFVSGSYIVEANATDYFTLLWTPPGGLYQVDIVGGASHLNFQGFKI
tara:strand:+ start:4706 stop:5239 length:534 start_codon:yes stop_codon:yes gene_type:complete